MKLTTRQGFCLMVCFLLGNVLSGIGGSFSQEKTGYLAVFVSLFFLFGLIFVYHIILKRNQYQPFFDLIDNLFGTVAGKIILVWIAVFSLGSAFFSLANYLHFIDVSTHFQTPEIGVIIVTLALVWYFCLVGEKTIGRYAEIVLPVVLIAVIILFACGIKETRLENLVFPSSIGGLFRQGAYIFVAPFSEIIFVYFLFDHLKTRESITKIACSSCISSVVIFALLYLFNLLILGQDLMRQIPFPTFFAASVVEIGTVIEKAETLITFSYTFCDLLYSGVCVLVGNKAIHRLVGKKKNTKKITAATTVIFLCLLLIWLRNTAATSQIFETITFVMIPFTLGLPLILLWKTFCKR